MQTALGAKPGACGSRHRHFDAPNPWMAGSSPAMTRNGAPQESTFSFLKTRSVLYLFLSPDRAAARSLSAGREDGDRAEQHDARPGGTGPNFFLLISVITH